MTTTSDEKGVLNQFAKEPEMHVDHDYRPTFAWDAVGERLNGRLAMVGFTIGVLTELITGQGIIAQLKTLVGG